MKVDDENGTVSQFRAGGFPCLGLNGFFTEATVLDEVAVFWSRENDKYALPSLVLRAPPLEAEGICANVIVSCSSWLRGLLRGALCV